ncbi:MAG: SelB C-terminal domain-containing protein, partial [Planctomycetales bacterium]|nr:SelB C-terminal domain-containing protein [Planctomycetales bacterium]
VDAGGEDRRRIVHRETFARACGQVAQALAQMHARHPSRSLHQRAALASRASWAAPAEAFDAILRHMAAEGTVRATDLGVALADHGPKLSTGQRELMERIVEQFHAAAFQPPGVKSLEESAGGLRGSVETLIAIAVADGRLVEFGKGLYLHADRERESREIVRAAMAGRAGMTLSEIRESLGTSRKFAVPLCEHFDRVGFTRRQGDLRMLADAQG